MKNGELSNKEKLQSLVDKSMHLLNTRGSYFTEGAKLAIKDMIDDAVLALKGEHKVPFIRNREFFKPRDEESILFTTRRYTMVPSYNDSEEVYYFYGLEPALKWFEKQDIMYDGIEGLLSKADFVIAKAEDLMNSSHIGKGLRFPVLIKESLK